MRRTKGKRRRGRSPSGCWGSEVRGGERGRGKEGGKTKERREIKGRLYG